MLPELLEKIVFKDVRRFVRREELKRTIALHRRHFGAAYVTFHPANGSAITGDQRENRLDQSLPKNRRNVAVDVKNLVRAVALVAAEELVAAVSGQQHLHAVLCGQASAEIRCDCGGVPERLIEIPDHSRQGVETILRVHVVGLMPRSEGLCR